MCVIFSPRSARPHSTSDHRGTDPAVVWELATEPNRFADPIMIITMSASRAHVVTASVVVAAAATAVAAACWAWRRRRLAVQVSLNYQARPPAGKRTGRNIGEHAATADDLVDIHVPTKVVLADARCRLLPPRLDKEGFELRRAPTACTNFKDQAACAAFYEEVRESVLKLTGASRVHVFDHTLRVSGNTNLNSLDGAAAGAVMRVHGDYTARSGPIRLQRLVADRVVSATDAAPRRFAFVNCWRNIDRTSPVLADPLCCCTWRSVRLREDAWPYLMMYPDRVGQNLALCNDGAAQHAWHYYPHMTCDEALFFKVYDSSDAPGVPRFVFHSAFKDPRTPCDAPPRQSIEVRTIAIWD